MTVLSTCAGACCDTVPIPHPKLCCVGQQSIEILGFKYISSEPNVVKSHSLRALERQEEPTERLVDTSSAQSRACYFDLRVGAELLDSQVVPCSSHIDRMLFFVAASLMRLPAAVAHRARTQKPHGSDL